MAEINGIKVPFIPIEHNVSSQPLRKGQGTSFESVFTEEFEKLKFSNHAVKRLETRNIYLNESEINKINDAVSVAESKGSKDSLVMMDNTAFIVNVPNRTVVTALPVSESSNIFTNIDSVVFA